MPGFRLIKLSRLDFIIGFYLFSLPWLKSTCDTFGLSDLGMEPDGKGENAYINSLKTWDTTWMDKQLKLAGTCPNVTEAVKRCLRDGYLFGSCWLEYQFNYDSRGTQCSGKQYIAMTYHLEQYRFVAVVLCTSTRYMIFVSKDLMGTFEPVQSDAVDGDDHCTLLPDNGEMLGITTSCWGVCPATASGSANTAKKRCAEWYECGMKIPGPSRLVSIGKRDSSNRSQCADTAAPQTTAVPTTTGNICDSLVDGFHADPANRCNFLRCFRGRLFRWSCPPGTAWNQAIVTCQHAWGISCSLSTSFTSATPIKTTTISFENNEAVRSCLKATNCWVRHRFNYEDNWNLCHGEQYVRRTQYATGRYIGVVLCSATRYKLFLGDSMWDTFKNIADGFGHGQDHCEFVGGNETTANLPDDFWNSPSAQGYSRNHRGETPSLSMIGFGPEDGSLWTGKYYVRWYECGIDIPGTSRVVTVNDGSLISKNTSAGQRSTTSPIPVTKRATVPPTTAAPFFKFIMTPNNVTAEVGEHVILECETNRKSVIKWYRGNLLVPAQEGVIPRTVAPPGGVLIIAGVSKHNTGHYTCRATNGSRTIVMGAWVELEGFEEKPANCGFDVVEQPSNATVKVGSFHLFQCYAKEANRAIWKKNGRNITSSTRVQLLPRGYLYLGRILSSDAGTYTCTLSKPGFACSLHFTATLHVRIRDEVSQVCGRPKRSQPQKDGVSIRRGYISGGTTAKKGSAPWQAMLYEAYDGFFCGGALIDRRHVVTAAHCFAEYEAEFRRPILKENLSVKLGKHDAMFREEEERTYWVESAFIHPNFNHSLYDKDIAVIRLTQNVKFTDNIIPLCVEDEDFYQRHMFTKGGYGTVTGWGHIRENVNPRYLHEIKLPLVPQRKCANSTVYPVTDNMFCAGYSREILGDTCKGDSGGPFVMKHEDKWYLVGLVSWGEATCGQRDKYGFYTRVGKFHDWLTELELKSRQRHTSTPSRSRSRSRIG